MSSITLANVKQAYLSVSVSVSVCLLQIFMSVKCSWHMVVCHRRPFAMNGLIHANIEANVACSLHCFALLCTAFNSQFAYTSDFSLL